MVDPNSNHNVRTRDAKLDKANKPKAPVNLVLPKPVRIPPPPSRQSTR